MDEGKPCESRVDLVVTFKDKDMAKAMGAKWDSGRKTWYAPRGEAVLVAKWKRASAVEMAPRSMSGWHIDPYFFCATQSEEGKKIKAKPAHSVSAHYQSGDKDAFDHGLTKWSRVSVDPKEKEDTAQKKRNKGKGTGKRTSDYSGDNGDSAPAKRPRPLTEEEEARFMREMSGCSSGSEDEELARREVSAKRKKRKRSKDERDTRSPMPSTQKQKQAPSQAHQRLKGSDRDQDEATSILEAQAAARRSVQAAEEEDEAAMLAMEAEEENPHPVHQTLHTKKNQLFVGSTAARQVGSKPAPTLSASPDSKSSNVNASTLAATICVEGEHAIVVVADYPSDLLYPLASPSAYDYLIRRHDGWLDWHKDESGKDLPIVGVARQTPMVQVWNTLHAYARDGKNLHGSGVATSDTEDPPALPVDERLAWEVGMGLFTPSSPGEWKRQTRARHTPTRLLLVDNW